MPPYYDDSRDPYYDDDYSSDTSDSPEERPRRTRRKRRPPPPSPSSSTPYFVIGVVVVILAAIGATTYILTRSGGLFSAAGGSGGGSASDSSSISKPSTLSTPRPTTTPTVTGGGGSTAGGDQDENEQDETEGKGAEESDEADSTSKPKPTKTSGSSNSKPSASSTKKPSTSVGTGLSLDFTTLSSASELDSYLSSNGIEVSTDPIGSEPITHTFKKENVDWVDGALRMTVKGQSGNGDISSSEITTTDSFFYGSVTTRLKASDVAGVCHGIFWYTNDNLEIDIELLTSYYTEGLGDAVKPGLQLTNQALVPGESSSNVVIPYGFDPTADFHDYTIDWSEGASTFYVDGKEVGTLTENVPSKPLKFLWNSWSSGEPNWSAGPPREDSYLLIESITANWTVAN
ncbi:hypothetical protein JCM3765_007726 [Sporobolomyces pararoseus]